MKTGTSAAFGKLVLIANFAPDGQQSMQRFEQMLAEGFTARGRAVEIWRPMPRFSKLSPGGYRYGGVPKFLGYLDKFFCFPREIRHRARVQPPGTVYHIVDHANAMYARHFGDAPVVVTVHDLLQIRSALGEFAQNRISKSGARYQRWVLDSLSRMRNAVCVSRKTREDLLRVARLAPECARVVEMGLNYEYRPMAARTAAPVLVRVLRRHGVSPVSLLPSVAAVIADVASVPAPFFVSVGGAQWYKNRTGLISIFAALRNIAATSRHRLVYVGPEFDAEQKALIQRHGLGGAIVHLRGVDNEELNALYSLARGLIFPSWEEGFGWPVAEAQACGCPVFASGRAPMTEVGGAGACYFDPANPLEAAVTIAQALAAEEKSLRGAALAESARWSTDVMLDKYEEVYAEAAGLAGRDAAEVREIFEMAGNSNRGSQTHASDL